MSVFLRYNSQRALRLFPIMNSGLTAYRRGEDVQLTKHFHLSEMECKCKSKSKLKFKPCSWTLVSHAHMERLQELREHLGRPITINSGYRCQAYNKEIGGADRSMHLIGVATDIVAKGVAPSRIADICEEMKFRGLGRYHSFTHIDSRSERRARWGK